MDRFKETLFQKVFEHLSEASVVVRADFSSLSVITANEAFCAISGNSATDLAGKNLLRTKARDDKNADWAYIFDGFMTCINSGTSLNLSGVTYDIFNFESVEPGRLDLELIPLAISQKGTDHILIQISKSQQPADTEISASGSPGEQQASRHEEILRQALSASKQDLDSINEELAASNEELISANEQIQSINQELTLSERNLLILNTQLEKRIADRTVKLSESESRFRSMIEQSPVPMLVTRGDNLIFEVVNPAMLELIDRDISVQGKAWFEAIPELKGQPIIDQLYRTYRTGEAWTGYEQPILVKRAGKSDMGFYNLSYTPLIEGEKITGVLQVAIDVTEQVKARKESEQSEQMLRLAVDSAKLGTWTYDFQSSQFSPSEKVKEVFGYDRLHEMPYGAMTEQIVAEYSDKVLKVKEESLNNNGSYDLEYPINVSDDHQLRWIRITGKLHRDKQGNASHLSGAVLDITENKLEDRRKDDFIGMVSHELKTPLTTLKGYVQILHERAKEQADDYASGAFERVNKQVNKMSGLINGFLDVSRLESGKILLEKKYFNLNAVLAGLIEDTKLMAPTHPIILNLIESFEVYADEEKIAAVVSNLLSNAMKYSTKGNKIEVRSERVGDYARVSVTDQGIGIQESHLERLFERYYRVESKENQNISGFGIGLYLSSEIIQRHYGKIWAQSKPGRGSSFIFEIPIA